MIRRDQYMQRLKAFKDNKLIKVITGLRRCGKSTLLQLFKQELLKDGIADDHIIDINFELMAYDDIRDYRQLYGVVREKIGGGKYYLLLDEIQQADSWEKAVNSLSVEPDIDMDIYITDHEGIRFQNIIDFLLSPE